SAWIQDAAQATRLMAEQGWLDAASAAPLLPASELGRIGVHLLFAIGAPEARIGILALGGKLSGVRYMEDDLDLLAALAHEASLAFERIRLQETALQERTKSERLEKLNELKSDFVSHVSHELRTPLASMVAGIRNLMDGIPEKPPPGIQSQLGSIHDSGAYLNRMIVNLLNAARIEADRLELNPEKVLIETVAAKTVGTLAPFASEKAIRLEADALSGFCVHADPDALLQVLSNLVENAIKYSPKGRNVRICAAPEGERRVAVSVEDQGIGIPPDKLGLVFERFERISEKGMCREKGLGLGLFIARKLVEAQGGILFVRSEPGRGSTFTFVLPSCS
ncbi:MAG TPA: HAMP domain-containing sensor histidine kinase, partial [bacterium]